MFRRLLAPLAGTATCMAGYLIARPYGDMSGTTDGMARAFAHPLWIASHVAGMLALCQFTRVASRLDDIVGTRLSRAARTAALVGLVGCLPYYGAETFALNALGNEHITTGVPHFEQLVEEVRSGAAAMTFFATGLGGYAATGVLMALTWQRAGGRPSWAAWPLGLLALGFLPQFYLPQTGRMAYGVAWAMASAVLAWASLRPGDSGQSAGEGLVHHQPDLVENR